MLKAKCDNFLNTEKIKAQIEANHSMYGPPDEPVPVMPDLENMINN